MSQRRSSAVAGVVGGRLVVAGGFCHGVVLTSVEAYTGTGWTLLPPMPHAVDVATACVLNGRLYVMGGMGSNTYPWVDDHERAFSEYPVDERPSRYCLLRHYR